MSLACSDRSLTNLHDLRAISIFFAIITSHLLVANTKMPDWYSLSQAIICAVGAMALYSLWSRTEEDPAQRDPCWLWLGHAVAIWAIVGLAIFSLGRLGFSAGVINTIRTFASILNSAFLLLAVAYFDYGPSKLKIMQAKPGWRYLVIGLAIVMAFLVVLTGQSFPDVGLSIFTLCLTAYGLFISFTRREFESLRWAAVLVVLLTLVAQIPEIDPFIFPQEIRFLLLLSSKTGLLVMFLCLSTTSVVEKSESPHTEEIMMEYLDEREADGWIIRLTLAPNKTHTGKVKGVPLKSLVLFTRKRLEKNGTGWLKLIDANLYASDLDRICKTWMIRRSFLFENDHHNGYRLRILPHNIKLPAPDWLDRDLS